MWEGVTEGTMKSAAQCRMKLTQTIGLASISQLASILNQFTQRRSSHVYSSPPPPPRIVNGSGKGAAQTKKVIAQSNTNLAQTNDTSFNSIRHDVGLSCLQPPLQNPQYLEKGSSTNEKDCSTIQHKSSTN